MGADPIFEQFLNQMFFGSESEPEEWTERGNARRSSDAVKSLPLTLEELYVGKHFKMIAKRKVICHSCRGSVPPYPILRGQSSRGA